jgi:hypothetical protein
MGHIVTFDKVPEKDSVKILLMYLDPHVLGKERSSWLPACAGMTYGESWNDVWRKLE